MHSKEEILSIIIKYLIEHYDYNDVTEETIVAHVPIANEWEEQLKLIDLSMDLERDLGIEISVDKAMGWLKVSDIVNTCLECSSKS